MAEVCSRLHQSTRDTDTNQEHSQQDHQRRQPPEFSVGTPCFVMPVNVPWHFKVMWVANHSSPPFAEGRDTSLLPEKFCIRDAIFGKSVKIPHIFHRFNKLDAAIAPHRNRETVLLSRYRTAFVWSLGKVSPLRLPLPPAKKEDAARLQTVIPVRIPPLHVRRSSSGRSLSAGSELPRTSCRSGSAASYLGMFPRRHRCRSFLP